MHQHCLPHFYTCTLSLVHGLYQVLNVPSGRSRSTTRRSCMRRATDSDIHPVTSSSQHPVSLSSQHHPVSSSSQHAVSSPSQHPVTGRAPSAAGQQSPASVSKPQAIHDSCDPTQPLGAAKVQRSLTWTEEGQAGVRWGTEGGPGGESNGVTRGSEGGLGANSREVTQSSDGSHCLSNGMTGTTMQQQQQDRPLGVSVQVSTTAEEATSSQSSPNVQPSKHGVALHRQGLTGSSAVESESGSSNSGQVLVPARFRTGSLSAQVSPVHCRACTHCLCLLESIARISALLALCGELPLGQGHSRRRCSQQLQLISLEDFQDSLIPPQLACLSTCIVPQTFTVCLKVD